MSAVEQKAVDAVPVKPPLWRRASARVGRVLRFPVSVLNTTDVQDRLFLFGVGLVWYGLHRFRPEYAEVTAGLLLVFAVRPLRRWF